MADAVAPRLCPMCATAVTTAAAFCSSCGTALGAVGTAPAAPRMKWYYNVWFVLFMLFFVTGPFGLPLVWKHPRWARWVKWTFTLVMVAYTWLLVATTIVMTNTIMQHFSDFQTLF